MYYRSRLHTLVSGVVRQRPRLTTTIHGDDRTSVSAAFTVARECRRLYAVSLDHRMTKFIKAQVDRHGLLMDRMSQTSSLPASEIAKVCL